MITFTLLQVRFQNRRTETSFPRTASPSLLSQSRWQLIKTIYNHNTFSPWQVALWDFCFKHQFCLCSWIPACSGAYACQWGCVEYSEMYWEHVWIKVAIALALSRKTKCKLSHLACWLLLLWSSNLLRNSFLCHSINSFICSPLTSPSLSILLRAWFQGTLVLASPIEKEKVGHRQNVRASCQCVCIFGHGDIYRNCLCFAKQNPGGSLR